MSSSLSRNSYDVVVVGGGHNGLTAAAYLARAGRSVAVLERLDHVGGAAVSARVFPGVDARLSRYSYLVSLVPRALIHELGLDLRLVRRRVSSYTPVSDGGLLDADGRLRGASAADIAAWQRFSRRVAALARAVWPTVTEPLKTADDVRRLVTDDELWEALVRRPLGDAVRDAFVDDHVRGVVATDALIGTFASMDAESLAQNRCYLYHVIGGGTGDWDVPVGGMGAVSGALEAAALAAGADVLTGAEVTAIDPDGQVVAEASFGEVRLGAGHVLAGCAPSVLARLIGDGSIADGPAPEGSQLKVNMLVHRLPRLRDASVRPEDAFAGTMHVHESLTELESAYTQAAAGDVPDIPPCEVYCHSLSDPSILSPALSAAGVHTLTLFGLHMPARLFTADPDGARDLALRRTIASLDSVLAEPLADVLLLEPDGRPCIEARTPVDLEGDVGLPGGHIFHRDLSWPWAEDEVDVGRWGVETAHPRVLLAGAGARRGGGVSGIPGRAAAMAVLGR